MITNAYANLTEFKSRHNITNTNQDTEIGTWLNAASRWIDQYCSRKFYSTLETRYFTPGLEHMVDLGGADLVSVTTLKTDPNADRTYSTTFATTDYDLLPFNARNLTPASPYTAVALTPNTTQFFPRVSKGLQIVGVFGYADQYPQASTLTAGINSSVTTVPVAAVTYIGVGSIIRVGSEDMAVDAISTLNLTVRRGMNGTTAAAHSSSDPVYVYEFGVIAEVAHMLANRLKARKDTPLGVSAITALGEMMVKAPKDDDILAMVAPYMRLL